MPRNLIDGKLSTVIMINLAENSPDLDFPERKGEQPEWSSQSENSASSSSTYDWGLQLLGYNKLIFSSFAFSTRKFNQHDFQLNYFQREIVDLTWKILCLDHFHELYLYWRTKFRPLTSGCCSSIIACISSLSSICSSPVPFARLLPGFTGSKTWSSVCFYVTFGWTYLDG